jgi:hypothetical protein
MLFGYLRKEMKKRTGMTFLSCIFVDGSMLQIEFARSAVSLEGWKRRPVGSIIYGR